MGRLEPEFRRLHWPPLVREAVETKDYPGYRYEFFSGFNELNRYFTELCGEDWYKQEWAEFWRNQHLETKNDDRKDIDFIHDRRIKPLGNDGPKRNGKVIRQLIAEYYKEQPAVSSYKLARYLRDEHGITITQKAVWSILKKLRSQNEPKG